MKNETPTLFARHAHERDVPVAGQRDPEDRGRRLAEGGASAGDGARHANDPPWRSRCMRLVPDPPCGPVNRALLVYGALVVGVARCPGIDRCLHRDAGTASSTPGRSLDDLPEIRDWTWTDG
jgi:hypothetical protein